MTKPAHPPLERIAYSVAEVAAAISLSDDEVYRLCASGELPSRKVGRRILIRRGDLEAWLDSRAAS